ncbi:MAG: Lsr2 family protein [Streptosporangiaceae bacterium]|nr:Lsr2 family protein [Streptosporangiaceae bacterium]
MSSRLTRPQLGLFGNPAGAYRLEELTETVRALESQQSGRTVDELSQAVFAELGMKRTRRATELVAEAIRLARARQPHPEIAGSQWQASTNEVRDWARSAGFEIGADGRIPEQAITAYNQTHSDRPY